MIDSDDVFLLRPSAPQYGLARSGRQRAPRGATGSSAGLFLGLTWLVPAQGAAAFAARFEHVIRPALLQAGAELLATYATAHEENNFPALPLRGEEVFTCFAAAEDAARAAIETAVGPYREDSTELLWLTPTARSILRR
jgi:hypothetical protein